MRGVCWSREDRAHSVERWIFVRDFCSFPCSRDLRIARNLSCGGGSGLVWTHLCRFLLHLVDVRENCPPIFSLFRQRRSSYIACFLKNWHVSSHLSLKTASSLQRHFSLRNRCLIFAGCRPQTADSSFVSPWFLRRAFSYESLIHLRVKKE